MQQYFCIEMVRFFCSGKKLYAHPQLPLEARSKLPLYDVCLRMGYTDAIQTSGNNSNNSQLNGSHDQHTGTRGVSDRCR